MRFKTTKKTQKYFYFLHPYFKDVAARIKTDTWGGFVAIAR